MPGGLSRVAFVTLALAGTAYANPLSMTGSSARSIGRAGTGLVSDDGAGALVQDPAALARRDTWRVQIGASFADDTIHWQSSAADAPLSTDQAGDTVLPQVAVVGSIGDFVVGAAFMTLGATDRELRDPFEVGIDQYKHAFDYRFAGVAGSMRRDAFLVGAAHRLGDSVAVGLSLGASRFKMSETRRMWVGFQNAIGDAQLGDPLRDLEVSFDADGFTPSATAGLFVAPEDTPIELGLSATYTKFARLDGNIASQGVTGGPSLLVPDTSVSIAVRQPFIARAGGRYVGDRVTFELGGELYLVDDRAQSTVWALADGTFARDARPANGSDPASTPLASIPSRLSERTHAAIRGALDVELVAGFLWVTGGYAYDVGGTAGTRLSPTFGDLGGHTFALGVEGTAGGFTYTAGWSRTITRARQGESAWTLDNPFDGNRAVNPGSYDGSIDQIGVLVDVELGGH
ncbi:MAG TPA: outer membrane protein transport protein [Kofleriaceae bacterium]